MEHVGPAFNLNLETLNEEPDSPPVLPAPLTDASFNILKEEQEKDKGYIRQLETQMNTLTEKLLLLENQRSTGNNT